MLMSQLTAMILSTVNLLRWTFFLSLTPLLAAAVALEASALAACVRILIYLNCLPSVRGARVGGGTACLPLRESIFTVSSPPTARRLLGPC